MKKVFLFSFLVVFISCNSYQKVLKSNDNDAKYNYAVTLFEKESYFKALPLFDEVASSMKGTENGQSCVLYIAYCNFYLKEYSLSGFYFKNYINYFPNSDKLEECLYMEAVCAYKESPRLSLDQEKTILAIDKLNYFSSIYPQSKNILDVKEKVKELEYKLEKKDYDNAKIYYDMEDYKSSIVALDNFIQKYPGSSFTEDVYFMTIKSNFTLAEMSIDEKKPERYNNTIIISKVFISNFPESLLVNEVKSILLYSKNYLDNKKNNYGL